MSNISPGLKTKHNQAASIVAQLSLEEKARLCSGKNFWHLEGLEQFDLPEVMVTDGPHGLRKQDSTADHVGLNKSVPATCFPTAVGLAATWNKELLHNIGIALGEQCVDENVTVLLGPGLNIKRHPYCGRNFEYFSEDPFLSGKMAAALIQGVQSQGVGTSIKHFAVNNQENGRMIVDAIVDERTIREIYLTGFEIAVKEAQPWTVMCAYNRLNGTYCSEHDWLLNQVLRDEWGFEGLVVTDWGAANNRANGIKAGLDLEMPGSGGVNDKEVIKAVQRGELDEKTLDQSIQRNLSLSLLGAELVDHATYADKLTHHNLARQAAAESVVLLKNEDQFLPLDGKATYAVIGEFAKKPRYQGAGSSQVNPNQLDDGWNAITEYSDALLYAPGYDAKSSVDNPALIDDAVNAARQAEVAIIFAGLPSIYESEGFDRDHLNLPSQHNNLIKAVCAVNPNTVVVLNNGAPVTMPWLDAPKAILEAYLPGQAGGSAIADLLFGNGCPSGKLAETFPWSADDLLCHQWFPGKHRQVQYREGLQVGYRDIEAYNKPVMFPFGHGLSYTSFEFSNLTIQQNDKFNFEVSLNVTNTGECEGAEVVQLYVHDCESSVYRPQQELKDFHKVCLQPGESQQVSLHLDERSFAFYDVGFSEWIVERGEFEIRIGKSSQDIVLKQTVELEGHEQASPKAQSCTPPIIADMRENKNFTELLGRPLPPPEQALPFHQNSTIGELDATWLGRMVQKRIIDQFLNTMGGSSNDATLSKMFEEMARNMPLRGMVLFSRGQLNFDKLNVLIALLNHQPGAAIKYWAQKKIEAKQLRQMNQT